MVIATYWSEGNWYDLVRNVAGADQVNEYLFALENPLSMSA